MEHGEFKLTVNEQKYAKIPKLQILVRIPMDNSGMCGEMRWLEKAHKFLDCQGEGVNRGDTQLGLKQLQTIHFKKI